MSIRYFARTDNTPIGRAAALFCDALVATGKPVRLLSTYVAELQVDAQGRSGSVWAKHRQLLITPMEGLYVNAVCGDVSDWSKFYTSGVTNALLVARPNLDTFATAPAAVKAAAERYELVYASSAEVATEFEAHTALRPIVVPVGARDAGGAFVRLAVF